MLRENVCPRDAGEKFFDPLTYKRLAHHGDYHYYGIRLFQRATLMAPTKKNSASVRRQARKHGEHVLAEIEALSIRMGGGKEVSFDIAAELSIPDDLNQLRKTGQTAPARMAFWSYQAERAAAALRRAQDELDEAEGTAYLAVREHFADQGESIQDKKVRCVAAQQTYVIDAREKVRELEEHHGIIKSLMFATAERSYMIRRMLKTEEFEMEEGR